MDIASVINGVLAIIALADPAAGPIILILERAVPYLVAAAPLVIAGIEEGPGAIAALEKAAPDLTSQIKALASHIPSLGITPDGHIENVARSLFGATRMTPEQEMAWMNAATPNVDDSKFGG